MISKQALLAGLLLLAVYVAGAISGVALTRVGPAARGLPAPPPGAVGFPGPAMSPGKGAFADQGFFTTMLVRRLDLSTYQEEQVRRVLEVHRQKLDSILAGIRPSMEDQFSEMDAAIRDLLTEDQAKDFEEFVNEQFARLGGRSPLGSRRGSRPEFRRRP